MLDWAAIRSTVDVNRSWVSPAVPDVSTNAAPFGPRSMRYA